MQSCNNIVISTCRELRNQVQFTLETVGNIPWQLSDKLL